MSEQVKIYFRLQQDEDGYPEVSVESVWAHQLMPMTPVIA